MQLQSLSISRAQSWQKEKGYIGKLTCDSPESEVSIKLSDEACRKILQIAGIGIKQAAAETANFLNDQATALQLENAVVLKEPGDDLPF